MKNKIFFRTFKNLLKIFKKFIWLNVVEHLLFFEKIFFL